MLEAPELIAAAALIAAMGVVVLIFRLQRELELGERGERTWIPLADIMMFVATLLALIAVVALLVNGKSNAVARMVATCACVASTVLVIGYFPAIAAHYRLIGGERVAGSMQPSPRPYVERPEAIFVCLSVVVAIAVVTFFILHAPAAESNAVLSLADADVRFAGQGAFDFGQ